MNEMEDRWLSISGIFKYLGVSIDTVYKWLDKNGMPAHLTGRPWKFKKSRVDGSVESGGAIEMTVPDLPDGPLQKYHLTDRDHGSTTWRWITPE